MSKKKKIVKMMFIGGEGARGDVKVGQIFELPEDWLEYKWFVAVEGEDEIKDEAPKPEKVEKPEEAKPTEKSAENIIQDGVIKPEVPPASLSQEKLLSPEELRKMPKNQLLEYLKSHGIEMNPKLRKAQILQKAVSLCPPEK